MDEIRDAVNYPVTRPVVGNTSFTWAVCLKIILIKIAYVGPYENITSIDRYTEPCPYNYIMPRVKYAVFVRMQ